MKWLIHQLAHLFMLNVGCLSVWEDDDKTWIGFQCLTCGRLQHVQECPVSPRGVPDAENKNELEPEIVPIELS